MLGAHCIALDNFPDRLKGTWFFVFDGDLGVRFFFAISGFIITWLLLREAAREGSPSLRGFWARRAVRILPAYVTFILALALIQWTTPWHLAPGGWWGALTFTANYNSMEQWLPAHLWSLSVEEQFYLLWPVAFVALKPWSHPRKALVLLSAVSVSCVVFQWMGTVQPTWSLLNGHSFLRRSDSIAFGCIGGVILWHLPARLAALWNRHRTWLVWVTLLVIAFPKLLEALRLCPPSHFPGSTAIQAMGLVSVLLWSQLEPRNVAFRLLQFKPVVLIGTWSYSIYLWQQVFSSRAAVFGFSSTPWWLNFPGWLLPSLVLGMTSFYLIEQPSRSKFRKRANQRAG